MRVVLSILALALAFAKPAQAGMFYKTQFTTFAHQPAHLVQPKLLYYGGPVISHVKVYAVFWDRSVDASLQKNVGSFYKAISNSTHMDWLNEYDTTNIKAVDGRPGTNQAIGRGTYGGEYLITPQITKTALDDKDIQAELENQLSNHVLPAPDENSLYMVYFPPGVSITIEGQTSCSTFCAYHNGFGSSKFGSVFYGVMPDLSSIACSLGCGFGQSALQQSTTVSSHEFFEAISDPFPTPGNQPAYPQAWNTTDGQEMGDLCAGSSGQLSTQSDTYVVQGEWDNKSDSCVTGPYQTNLK